MRLGALAPLRFFFVVHQQTDGNRVKSVLNGETVIYVGNLYEKKVVGSTTTHTKYYYFGGRRIAVRVAGTRSSTSCRS